MEHALCPLDATKAIRPGLLYDASYQYTDKNRNRKTARAQVAAPFGFSPNDELYLYGLLSLTFAQADPSVDFYATPHWCLKQLGLVDSKNSDGKRYRIFREAIRRLSGVVYTNDRFFDPVRGEHRDVAFGFLKYSLPIDPESSRAWHFVHDSQWFQFCRAVQGSFSFDFQTYRQLDFASRRLFLLLQKMFHRIDATPRFELRSLGVETLGFNDSLATKEIKQKLIRVAGTLLDLKAIRLPASCKAIRDLFQKERKGVFSVTFHRGSYFDGQPYRTVFTAKDSPLYEPLEKIGFDTATIKRLIGQYRPSLIQQWSDITLSAIEQKRINQSPEAFFMYHVKLASEQKTTPPDWWRELRKAEFATERANRPSEPDDEQAFNDYLAHEGREAFERVMNKLFVGLRESGQTEPEARSNAEYTAKVNLRRTYRVQSKTDSSGGMLSMAELLKRWQ
ncbi:hypothetical protein [Rhodopirellula sallentina]|uniref:Replication initiator protein A n=1 Tax=Rhodopirellula sallentina SM41 TaxID=1263870 RepID=M5UM79_9BACT|nr:hypothetical protein [Rhodopirellula sallentina]EMI57113.1 hypothetical protein RSSM_01439 [Rhodopirellula sallentina SM41]